MREIKAVADANIDLAPYGYKPGTNFFYCSECSRSPNYQDGNWPHMGAAGSTRCIHHALEHRTAELRALEGQLICEFGRNPIEIAIWNDEASQGKSVRALVLSAIFAIIAMAALAIYFP